MRPSVTLGALVLTAAVSFGIYQLKYHVVRLEEDLAKLNRDLIAERQAVKVVKAEWSYLNRPERLYNLAARYLELGPAVVRRLARLDDLPLSPREDAGAAVAAEPPLPIPKPLPRSRAGAALLASMRPTQ